MSASHFVARIEARQTRKMSEFGFREPFGWRVAGLGPSGEGEIQISWPDSPGFDGAAHLRIAVLDTREPRFGVGVLLKQSGRILGEFDIRSAAHFQVYEVALSATDVADLKREGAILRVVEGDHPLWILIGSDSQTPLPDALTPHLLPAMEMGATEKRAAYFERLASLSSVQCFGWMEGCVLDGLGDLVQIPRFSGFITALHEHLGLFFPPDGGPTYEAFASWPDGSSAFGAPADGRIYGIEATLPFATLCREFSDHPALQIALDFWENHADESGAIQDGAMTSTEGSYTVAYPMAVIATQRGDAELARRALLQVTLRHERLFDGQKLPRTRTLRADGEVEFGNVNWARGAAWQLLGAARTLRELESWCDISLARTQFCELAAWTRGFQLPNGLWSVFLDEPELAPDTSGSAAIAAAFAIGTRCGWLGEEFLDSAHRTDAAMDDFLTPDGFLFGASGPNKNGEAFQRSPYRPIYQMGMGVMAQLIAAIETSKL